MTDFEDRAICWAAGHEFGAAVERLRDLTEDMLKGSSDKTESAIFKVADIADKAFSKAGQGCGVSPSLRDAWQKVRMVLDLESGPTLTHPLRSKLAGVLYELHLESEKL